MPVVILGELKEDNHFLGEAECCGERFLFEVTDIQKNTEEPGSAVVNMAHTASGFPLAKCPKCGALET